MSSIFISWEVSKFISSIDFHFPWNIKSIFLWEEIFSFFLLLKLQSNQKKFLSFLGSTSSPRHFSWIKWVLRFVLYRSSEKIDWSSFATPAIRLCFTQLLKHYNLFLSYAYIDIEVITAWFNSWCCEKRRIILWREK